MNIRVFSIVAASAGVALLACAPPALELRKRTVHLTVHTRSDARVPELLREKLLSLRDCYDASTSGTQASGVEVELSVTFDRRGRVKSLTSPNALTGYVQRCVKDRITSWRIGAQPQDQSFGPYVIRFRPPDGGSLSGPGGPEIHFSGRRRMQPPPRRRVVSPPRRRVVSRRPGVGSRVRARLRARVYGLRRCYNRQLTTSPRLSGAVKISFWILPSGRVGDVRVVSRMSDSFVRCVLRKVRRWNLGKVPAPVLYGPFVVRFTQGQ